LRSHIAPIDLFLGYQKMTIASTPSSVPPDTASSRTQIVFIENDIEGYAQLVAAVAPGVELLTPQNMPAHTHTATFTGTGGGAPVQPTITVKVSTDTATAAAGPADGFLATAKSGAVGAAPFVYSATATSGATALNSLTAVATGGSGGGITGGTVAVASVGQAQPAPVTISANADLPAAMPPFVAMNYIIATEGIYPPRP